MKNIFTEGWELRCETQLLAENRNRQRVYICSPLRAQNRNEVIGNMRNAKAYMYYAFNVMGYLAFAPHAFLPAFLNDEDESDRKFALAYGLQVLKQCQAIFVCGARISQGMEGEIFEAARMGLSIRVFAPSLLPKIKQIWSMAGGDPKAIETDIIHLTMASEKPVTCYTQNILAYEQSEKENKYAVSI